MAIASFLGWTGGRCIEQLWPFTLCLLLIGCAGSASAFEMGLESVVKMMRGQQVEAIDPSVGPPRPAGAGACPTSASSIVFVKGFPSSPVNINIPLFAQPYQAPPELVPVASHCDTQDPTRCMDAYEIDIVGFQKVLAPGLPPTNFLGYNGISPGPTISTQRGRQSVVRFKNSITGYFKDVKAPGSTYGPVKARDKNPCGDSSRATLIHNHGHASIPAFDGWADDILCYGQFKDYVYPNSDLGTFWYHDHTANITAENTFYGLVGFNFVRSFSPSCPEPFNLDSIPQKPMILSDKLLDSNAQLYLNRSESGKHDLNFYGDINMVNGVPFPFDAVEPRQYLYRFLVTGPSRPYLIQIVDSNNVPVHSQICQIVAPDQGIRGSPVPMPVTGLPIGVSERYTVLCDFSSKAGQTLYFVNGQSSSFVEVPYFCRSHLIMRVDVSSDTLTAYPSADFKADPRTSPPKTFTQKDLADARMKQDRDAPTRNFQLSVGAGHWTIDSEGWKDPSVPPGPYHLGRNAADVGMNTWELWRMSSASKDWFHPLHIHLIRFYVLGRNGNPPEPYEFDESLQSGKDVVFWHPPTPGGTVGRVGTVDVAARFGPFKGIYMFHCHNTVHEDDQMMRAFKTIKASMGRNKATALPNTDKLDPSSPVNPKLELPDSIPALPISLAQPFTNTYLQSIFNRRYYAILYPRPSEGVIHDPSVNPWIAPQEGDCTAA